MATRTIETETGVRPGLPSPISLAWMPRKLSVAASDSLDLIRAVAACVVMIGHLRTLFFVDFGHLSHGYWPLEALYFFTGFGHQAVIVFFVLSGFLISSTVIRSHGLGKWSWRDYAINRATRLVLRSQLRADLSLSPRFARGYGVSEKYEEDESRGEGDPHLCR